MMRHWAFLLALPLAASTIRIIQTNSAGDSVHIIDPATDKVVGEIAGIEVNHGVAAAPDGSRYYVSDEAENTLDVVDVKTLKVTRRIPLSGRPNNIAISRDGARVYVSIIQPPGAVDVIDTVSLERIKSLPMKGGVHNTYVTPDGRFVVAGSIAGKILTVVDQRTEKPVWELAFDNGVRPIAFTPRAISWTEHPKGPQPTRPGAWLTRPVGKSARRHPIFMRQGGPVAHVRLCLPGTRPN